MYLKTETKVGLFVLISILIFSYIAIHLGVFKFYVRKYKPYTVYFDDLAGLAKKADVKIAGVKVGWVDDFLLVADGTKAKVRIMILSDYVLYSNAYAEIHQEGLLGARYLEVVPGSPSLSVLPAGATLSKAVGKKVSVEDLLNKFDGIAKNIEDVSISLKGAIGTVEGENQLRSIVDNIKDASEKIVVFSDALSRNEGNIDTLLSNLRSFSSDLAPIGKNVQSAAEQLNSKVLPSFRTSIEKISNIFDRDFGRVANRLDSTIGNLNSVVSKIDKGRGSLGKLINEPEVYEDIKVVAHGFRDAADVLDNMGVVVDSHFESMNRKAENYKHKDAKGYFDFRLHTNEDTFYTFEVAGSEKGTIDRRRSFRKYFDDKGHPLSLDDIRKYPPNFSYPPFEDDTKTVLRNTTKLGFQVGKIYRDLALRFGIFENTVGAGVDYEIPFCNDNFRWVTSLEAFDLRGQDRLDDRRPHLKWINRIYLLRNFYMNFGADDFISRKNASGFFGVGIRFSDDDLKYLLSRMGFLTGGLGVK